MSNTTTAQNVQNNEILKYLESLKEYLYGDLENYKKICEEVRRKENEYQNFTLPETSSKADSKHGTSFTDNQPIATSTTTAQTTAYPGYVQGTTKYFSSTIPHVLSLFATIDFVGFLQTGSAVGNLSINNFKAFFNDCDQINEEDIKILFQLFRNGHTHEYFAKNGLGISDSNPNAVNKKIFYLDNNRNIILNVEILIELTKKQFVNFLKKYKCNTETEQKVNTQYEKIINKTVKDLCELGFDLEAYKNQLYQDENFKENEDYPTPEVD